MTDEEKLEALGQDKMPDFCVTVDFPKNTRNPQRVLNAAAAYIDALQSLDSLLVSSIDVKIKPVFVLEEIEIGSLKLWVKQILEAIDDDALKNLDWKPAVGKYLVRCKYRFIQFLGGKKNLTARDELDRLTEEFHVIAKETKALQLPSYKRIPAIDLAHEAKKIGDAVCILTNKDFITFQSDDGDARLDPGLIITQEAITDIFSTTAIVSDIERILMVRRPDFLGDAKWEFKHEKRSFTAKISDEKWLNKYHSGNVDIRPGDALRVTLRETVTYDQNGEVVKEDREIVSVSTIIKPAIQGSLLVNN